MIEYVIEVQNKFSLGIKELWQYRELFYFFTWRDVKVKYKQAALGILWAILQPLVMMVMFTLIFSKALNVGSDGIPYPVLLGGDDLTIIIRGELAVGFTEVFLKGFALFTKNNFAPLAEKYNLPQIKDGLSSCAGIAFIKPNYPFHLSH